MAAAAASAATTADAAGAVSSSGGGVKSERERPKIESRVKPEPTSGGNASMVEAENESAQTGAHLAGFTETEARNKSFLLGILSVFVFRFDFVSNS